MARRDDERDPQGEGEELAPGADAPEVDGPEPGEAVSAAGPVDEVETDGSVLAVTTPVEPTVEVDPVEEDRAHEDQAHEDQVQDNEAEDNEAEDGLDAVAHDEPQVEAPDEAPSEPQGESMLEPLVDPRQDAPDQDTTSDTTHDADEVPADQGDQGGPVPSTQVPSAQVADGRSAGSPGPDPLDLSVPVDDLEPLPLPSEVLDAGTATGESQQPAEQQESPEVGSADSASRTEPSFDEVVQSAGPRPGTHRAPAADDAMDDAADDAADDEVGPDHDDTAVTPASPASGWRAVGRVLRPRLNRSQGLVALLCGALGFALVVQVQQSAQDPLSSARQDDLVRLLDEVTQRSEQLDDEVAELTRTRDELASGTGQAQSAVDLAEQRAQSEGILSGRLPAVGPGLEIVVRDPSGVTPAAKLFNVLEELRNAGAEVVELNGIRLVTSSWFLDTDAGVTVDGQAIESPYRWSVIGDPATLNPALEIPGGALAQLRSDDVDARVVEQDEVEINATREPAEPQYATPRSPEE
ncbi:DUF881 domain-containing protein [Isoptericola jiangsuensis]|uniref:DUF881 domain-containing protein n=1 Tax=Isoptericola jiangsuensis TaxID=548579 RepID=UPI003AAA9A90